MHLYFIRHAQSKNNALWSNTGSRAGRSDDPHITKLGKEQAELLANYLPQRIHKDRQCLPIAQPENENDYIDQPSGNTFLYCSLYLRAIETGFYLANAMNIPLRGYIDIHENGGVFRIDQLTGEYIGTSGKSRSYLQKHYPSLQLPPGLGEEGWWNKPFEERPERRARAKRVLDFLLAEHKPNNDTVVMVSHQGFYNYLLREVFAVPLESENWFELYNTAISYIQFRAGFINIVYHNNYEFLPADFTS